MSDNEYIEQEELLPLIPAKADLAGETIHLRRIIRHMFRDFDKCAIDRDHLEAENAELSAELDEANAHITELEADLNACRGGSRPPNPEEGDKLTGSIQLQQFVRGLFPELWDATGTNWKNEAIEIRNELAKFFSNVRTIADVGAQFGYFPTPSQHADAVLIKLPEGWRVLDFMSDVDGTDGPAKLGQKIHWGLGTVAPGGIILDEIA